MTKPNNVDRLKHILDAIAKIERYLHGLDSEIFRSNEQKIDAVVRNIEIIGEAAACLTRDLKAKYPEIEWRIATATRNRLIHGYFDIDANIIWDTCENDLPNFKSAIEKVLKELDS
ncbi:MAG: HepT-like ribonuclease domain-containing protein [Pyrinomonadaceae bacterium]